MDLVVERFPHGFLLKAADGRQELDRVHGDIVAIYPQMGIYAGEVYDDCANDGLGRLRGPLSDILAAIARRVSEHPRRRSRSRCRCRRADSESDSEGPGDTRGERPVYQSALTRAAALRESWRHSERTRRRPSTPEAGR
jgi:hypothetical protein